MDQRFTQQLITGGLGHYYPRPSAQDQMSERSRNFCFTHNNYANTDLQDNLACKYICYGREVGESGTPHLQGFVCFHTMKSLKQVIAMLPGCHIEVAKGNVAQNIAYCSKGGLFTERGQRPQTQQETGMHEKERWRVARQAAIAGNFEEIPDDIYIRCYTTLKKIHADHAPKPETLEGDMEHEWICGPAGCGKSSTARNENPGYFTKDLTKWWDNYAGEEVVIIDDVDKYDVQFARLLKLWSDRYSFQAESKGKTMLIRPRKIVVTSQYTIEEIWQDEQTRAALNRRFKTRLMAVTLHRSSSLSWNTSK